MWISRAGPNKQVAFTFTQISYRSKSFIFFATHSLKSDVLQRLWKWQTKPRGRQETVSHCLKLSFAQTIHTHSEEKNLQETYKQY